MFNQFIRPVQLALLFFQCVGRKREGLVYLGRDPTKYPLVSRLRDDDTFQLSYSCP